MTRRFDYIDLRVRLLSEVRRFYRALLPTLGFTRNAKIELWLQYEGESTGNALIRESALGHRYIVFIPLLSALPPRCDLSFA